MKIVAVTSCPTGIAHTYMAAEALEQAAKDAGHEITVETQGAAGATPIGPEVIAGADAVVFAADVPVRDRERFAGKPLVETSVKRAINDPKGLVTEAEQAAANAPALAAYSPGAGAADTSTRADAGGSAGTGPEPATTASKMAGFGTHLRQWLMTGVSYMIPFVAAGGILIALSYMIGGAEVANKVNGGTFQGVDYGKGVATLSSTQGVSGLVDLTKLLSHAGWAGVLFEIGQVAFAMLVPVLAGFIAYAMVDRLGLVPGFVAGLISVAIGAGFLGGLIGGLLAGAVVMLITKVKVPRALAGMMPIVVIPLVSTAVVGILMIVVVGQPVAAAQRSMTDWLNSLSGSNAILLGALLGLMMGFDLGGPVNKVAYTFALASLASGNIEIMAAVMAAGMAPPLACALATVARPRLFSKAERTAGEAAWLLGASFITEGAIPFAAAAPVRVIPSTMVGSAVTGGLSMAFGCTSRAPHGGIWVVGLIGKPFLWVVAILAGVLVSAICMVSLKSFRAGESDDQIEQEIGAGTAPGLPAPRPPAPAGAR
ncbi:MAG: PTS fructose transporter subunit IIC [Frankiaceae bacterium]